MTDDAADPAGWCYGGARSGRSKCLAKPAPTRASRARPGPDSYRRELDSGWSAEAPGTEAQYTGRGIGAALCEESIRWARERGYVAVLAPGAPDGLLEFARWAGHLPWTTYAKLGFKAADVPYKDGEELPGWAQDLAVGVPEYLVTPANVMSEARNALAAGRPASGLRERLMLLQITDSH